ncbi:MAG: hypothetical protein IT439_09405 [Phycisphaerales bacterium]|nr:hypothetical protein [Phycisphaerales bacterium]
MARISPANLKLRDRPDREIGRPRRDRRYLAFFLVLFFLAAFFLAFFAAFFAMTNLLTVVVFVDLVDRAERHAQSRLPCFLSEELKTHLERTQRHDEHT